METGGRERKPVRRSCLDAKYPQAMVVHLRVEDSPCKKQRLQQRRFMN